ncbi:filament-like plant protein 4 [Rhodamnia argentea]|uniref:Filament-like plant protein 4 n=1 Tax=Rhodamnia argentea TaxID=178133 RepID=A0A8B8MQG3_9MYRT|nr:filament-like plant protein 4 [Rhodamnia argentea]
MERRSWPWKRKSSDKAAAEKAAVEKAAAVLDSAGASPPRPKSQSNQETYKKPNYVQISVESYTHLTGLEDQVKFYEEQVQTLEDHIKDLDDHIKELDEQLSTANSEITAKDTLAKQHAKVAEDAVSGWEKAEAEALALKSHLESVTLSKLTAEDRASHLDGALKECMRQIRNLKEDHERNLQEVVLTKTKQWENFKHDLEVKIVNLDQELLKSAAENAAISRSLQERSNMLIKMSEQKSQAEAEIEMLKSSIESLEREMGSLKYEVHVVSKELEIRNEEKNLSMRSAEAANKQHMEGVKKIAKLETECQRLRGLVRKRLPGPAAVAQMKLEVESLGRDYGESRLKRSPVKPSSPHYSHGSEFSLDNVQNFHKENEFLTERLLAMEEEMKMLKEALAARNTELQTSRNMCAKITSKLQTLETQLQITSQERSLPKSAVVVPAGGSLSHNESNPPSLISMSEDGNDDGRSCADSWATTSFSELSQFKKDRKPEPNKADDTSHSELMDDFLEMEKLASLSNNSNESVSCSDNSDKRALKNVDNVAAMQIQEDSGSVQTLITPDALPSVNNEVCIDQMLLMKLQSRMSSMFESVSKEDDMDKILKDIKQVMLDAFATLQEQSVSLKKCKSDSSCCTQACSEEAVSTALKDANLSEDLAGAITHIKKFVLLQRKEALTVRDIPHDADVFGQEIDEFLVTFQKVLNGETSLASFVLDLSSVLTKASELNFNVLGYKDLGSEMNSPDCIDKVALPENKVVQPDSSKKNYQNRCGTASDTSSNPEFPDCGNLASGYDANTMQHKVSLEEHENLKLERENMVSDLARYSQNLETIKIQLQETEELLSEVKSQLASAQKSNSLAETQLKCMAESYRSLEIRAQGLETEVNILRAKTESLNTELQEEKRGRHDALARCKDLHEQLQRAESCLIESGADNRTKQEKELSAAAEKLAECQETIFLLGKQLQALCPQTDLSSVPTDEISQEAEGTVKDEPTSTSTQLQSVDHAEIDSVTSYNLHRESSESALALCDSPGSPSDAEEDILRSPVNSKHPKHRTTSSGSSSSSSPTLEKKTRGFSRFFSAKGENGN